MATSQIIGNTFDDGLKAPHYINRRLLTAEDLKADQQAVLARLGLLGKAIGHGVVDGLEVEQIGSVTLRVNVGLGINRSGSPIRLPRVTPLTFGAPPATPAADRDGGRFQDCSLAIVGTGSAPNSGAYLLAVAPTSRLEGSAPVKAAAGSTATPPCAAQWEVEGLQFRAIRLDGFDAEPAVTGANRRNRLAHWCYDSAAFPALERDYLAMGDYGGLSRLGVQELTGCDLPLAVFYWNGSAISDVDIWSVRRRLVQSGALTQLGALVGDRRAAEGQARLLQFQSHLDALLKASTGAAVRATASFPLLPPAGLLRAHLPEALLRQVAWPLAQAIIERLIDVASRLPIFGGIFGVPLGGIVSGPLRERVDDLVDGAVGKTVQSGIDPEVFFGDHPLRYGLIDADAVDELVRRSWYHNAFAASGEAPVDLLVSYADVVQLLAPGMREAAQSLNAFFTSFGIPFGLFAQEAEGVLIARVAELANLPAELVKLEPQQPVALFAKQLRPTEYLSDD